MSFIFEIKNKRKKEIVTLGEKNIDPENISGEYLDAESWDKFIVEKDSVIIDTRNIYESEIGTFKSSLKTQTKSFRDFPKWIERNKKKLENKKIGMFCTGGIRCEKAGNFLIKKDIKIFFNLRVELWNI